MKIVLISPKGPLYRHRSGIFKKSLRYQPLTLTTLASLIPAELKADVQLIDEGIQEIPDSLTADVIGMTVITGTAPRAYELAGRFRRAGTSVVLGGPHVTLVPAEAAENADAICVGYAEETWPRLLHDIAKGQMQRTYVQDPHLKLENFPFPRRDLLDKRYFLTQAVFEATRSCVHDCEFCVAPAAWGRTPLQRPIEWVIEDIRRVGQKKIIFVDLNLISDVAYARALFSAMIPLHISWYGLSTVLIAHDRPLMELMARSGCKGLLLGLETISDGSLNYKNLLADLHQLGIAVQGCFVFGLDHDTPRVFDETVDFAIDAGVDLPRFAVLTPFPGTPLHERLAAEGRILTKNWELYDGQHVVFEPKHMSADELRTGHERAWKRAYDYASISRRLWNAKLMTPVAIGTNLGYRYYSRHLEKFYTCDWRTDLQRPQESGTLAQAANSRM
jgi:radical SAM superfamily enzyme YgiQ (UPF0313 family)